jgi:drug/metabolite transporter (DMT)-like permease
MANLSATLNHTTNKIILGYGLVLVIWSTTPLAIKVGVMAFDAQWAFALRMVLATIVALMVSLVLCFKKTGNIKAILPLSAAACFIYFTSGFALFAALQLVYIASDQLNSGTVSVLHGIGPMLSALFSSLLLNKHLTWKRWGALVGALFGLVIVFYAKLQLGFDFLVPMLMVVLAISLHMFSAVLVQKFNVDMSAMDITLGGLIVCTGFTGLSFLLFQSSEFPSGQSIGAWLSILYLAIMSSLIAYMIYYFLLQKISVVSVGLITIITPAFALLLGSWVANEQVSSNFMLGTGVILVSLIVFMHSKGR